MKKQYAAIDIAKYVSALLVVCIHTYPLLEVSETLNTFFIQVICRMAVPFFFVSSGYFFFQKEFASKEESLDYLIRYEKRLFKIYAIWTIVYLPYTILDYAHSGFRLYHVLSYLRDVVLNGSYYHLWFLPALMLGTFIVWILLTYIGPKRMYQVVGSLYFVGYLINVFTPIWQSLPFVSFVFGFFTKLMVTSRNGLFFAPIFLAIGYLLATTKRLRRKVSGLGWCICTLLLACEVSLYYFLGILRDLTSMYLLLVPLTFFMTNFLLTSHRYYKPVYLQLRHESLLIYTSHILFAAIGLKLFPNAHLVVFFLTVAGAQTLAALVLKYRKRYPILEHLL